MGIAVIQFNTGFTKGSLFPNSIFMAYLTRLLQVLGYMILLLLECSIGFHLGMIAGCITGWTVGSIYSEYYAPVHFISVEVVRKWYYLPSEYAGYGVIIGAIVGTSIVLLVTLIKSIKQHQKENTKNISS
jgi:hypothetical protein